MPMIGLKHLGLVRLNSGELHLDLQLTLINIFLALIRVAVLTYWQGEF